MRCKVFMDVKQTTYSAVLGSIVTNCRKANGQEQSDIAEILGITQASYSRLESGKSSMTTDQIFLVSNAVGLLPSELLAQVENSVQALNSSGYKVIPQLRGDQNRDSGKVVLGAALGALLMGILSTR